EFHRSGGATRPLKNPHLFILEQLSNWLQLCIYVCKEATRNEKEIYGSHAGGGRGAVRAEPFFGWGAVWRTAILLAGSGSDRLPASLSWPWLYLGGRIL